MWQASSFKIACCATNSTSQDIQVCFRCAFYIELCIIWSNLGGLKITHLKTILGVWWCAITLACLKRQGLMWGHVRTWRADKVDAKSTIVILFNITGSLFFIASTSLNAQKSFLSCTLAIAALSKFVLHFSLLKKIWVGTNVQLQILTRPTTQ